MKKYNVHLLAPIASWDDVEAESEDEAVKKIEALQLNTISLDPLDGPYHFSVEEVEEDEI